MTGLDSLAFACVALSASLNPEAPEPLQQARVLETKLHGAAHNFERVQVLSAIEDLPNPKISPLNQWTFNRVSNVYCRAFADREFPARFRVFAHNEEWQRKLGHPTGVYLGRLWDLLRNRLQRDHEEKYRNSTIDVFLCQEGQAGGEQMLAPDPFELDRNNKEPLAMMIYIYQIGKWTRPIDRCRELAHEYGQATLPSPGGFPAPEPWANGILGESLFLTWLRKGISEGRIKSDEAFGVTVAELDAYLAERVAPKLRSAALKGPQTDLLKTKSKEAFDAYVGLHLWAESILPRGGYSRGLSLGVVDDSNAAHLPTGLAEGASEQKEWEMKAPAWAGKSPVWIPLAKGTVSGAKVLKRDPSGWALIQPTAEVIRVTNPPIDP